MNIEPNSVVIIDDQFEEAICDPEVARAFKVHRRHMQFSLILITQNLYEKGRWAKTIRNNTEILVIFKNFGDALSNSRLTSQLELKNRYKECMKDANKTSYPYCVINTTSKINDDLRVQFNIFNEYKDKFLFPICYTDN